MSDPAPPRPLQYARRPRASRWVRRLFTAVVVLAVICVVAWLGPPFYRQAGVKLAERRLLEFDPPADTIVLTNDAAESERLFAASGEHVLVEVDYVGSGTPYPGPIAGYAPRQLDALALPGAIPRGMSTYVEAPGPTGPPPTLFLHKLQPPAGPARLVHVTPALRWDDVRTPTTREVLGATEADLRSLQKYGISVWLLSFDITAYAPASWKPGSVRTQLPLRVGRAPAYMIPTVVESRPQNSSLAPHAVPCALRLFAARPDPADASRFTFRYELAGESGVIDGTLLADDTVKFQVRSGPLTEWTWPAN